MNFESVDFSYRRLVDLRRKKFDRMISGFESAQEAAFTLRVYSSVPVNLGILDDVPAQLKPALLKVTQTLLSTNTVLRRMSLMVRSTGIIITMIFCRPQMKKKATCT